jgi:hypothetical protein
MEGYQHKPERKMPIRKTKNKTLKKRFSKLSARSKAGTILEQHNMQWLCPGKHRRSAFVPQRLPTVEMYRDK